MYVLASTCGVSCIFDLICIYMRTYVGQYPQISDDLVNSHHLLLCCVDMLYNAVLLGDKMDMINMESLKNGLYTDTCTYCTYVCMYVCTVCTYMHVYVLTVCRYVCVYTYIHIMYRLCEQVV